MSVGLSRLNSKVLLAAAAGVFGSLDTALNVAFPDLVSDFDLAVDQLQWVIVFYVLVYGGLLLAAGQLADSWGYARVLRIGAGVSSISLVLCATAPTFELLLAARVLQGIGVAMVMASAPALLTSDSAAVSTRAVGVFQTAAAVGLAIGPIVGGPLVEWQGWRAVFWFRFPLGLLLLLLAVRTRTTEVPKSSEVDRIGAFLVSVSLGASVLALNLTGTRGWSDSVVIIAASVAVFSAAAFIALSNRVEHPIVELALFRSIEFSAANILAIVANGAMFATWLLVPSLLVDHLGASLLVSGLVLAASPAATAAASLFAGRWSGRNAGWRLSAAGLIIEGVGMLGLSQVNATWSAVRVALLMAVVGVGLGLFSVPNMAAVMQGVGTDKQGVAGALSLMTRTVGIVAGVAAASAFAGRIEPARGFLKAFEAIFTASGIVLCGVALLAAILAARPAARTVG